MFEQIPRFFHSTAISGKQSATDIKVPRPFLMAPVQREMSTKIFGRDYKHDGPLNPYLYTSGGWLHLDDTHQRSRQINLDFPVLLQRAVEASPGATRVLEYEAKFEGGYNRAFVLRLDNGRRVVARIPFHHSGPPTLATNSEVATIAYLRAHTSIPLPNILAWSDDASNATGTEYMIMEHVSGVNLHKAWPEIDPRQHFSSVKTLVDYMCQMSKLSFPAYGSIYFEDGPLSPSEKIIIGDGFCIGPNCHPEYWPGTPGEPRSYNRRPPNRGPWRDLESYVSGLIDKRYSLLPDAEPPVISKWQGSIGEHLHLLKDAAGVVQALSTTPQIRAIAAPKLLHPDYAKRNIFISDGGIVTCIIDWQFTEIEPTFSYADNNSDFLFPHATVEAIATKELGLGADESSLRERASKVKNRFDILQKLFSVGLQISTRDLHQARQTDEAMLRPFKYCGTSWRDSAVALREELVSISKKWTMLGLDGSCPYQPTAEELAQHKNRFEAVEAAMELKMTVVRAAGSDLDGWVEPERFDAAVQTCHELYVKLVEGEKGDSRMLAESM